MAVLSEPGDIASRHRCFLSTQSCGIYFLAHCCRELSGRPVASAAQTPRIGPLTDGKVRKTGLNTGRDIEIGKQDFAPIELEIWRKG